MELPTFNGKAILADNQWQAVVAGIWSYRNADLTSAKLEVCKMAMAEGKITKGVVFFGDELPAVWIESSGVHPAGWKVQRIDGEVIVNSSTDME